jgi:N-hydroxyarylamine O-acetyltransferase
LDPEVMTVRLEHSANDDRPPVDLPAYLARIGYEGTLDPTLETLKSLHFAHASTIPFENLDILLGRGISLDPADLQAKLVTARRGGYCFEQNALFAAVLESLGFPLRRLAARVQFGATEIRPRTHMLLEVEVENEPWLVDVGFGSTGPRYPVALRRGEPDHQGAWTYRVKNEGDAFVLQSHEPDGWLDLYVFTREPQYAVDYVIANHYMATHPHSPFVQNLIVQKGSLSSRLNLHNGELTEVTPAGTTVATVAEDDSLLGLLADRFGLELPPKTRFRRQPQA